MEPALMVVGLNYRTAPVAVRERFWISEPRCVEAVSRLSRAEGIEEIIVVATCNRTEFWMWVTDVTLAENSVMRFLGTDYGLMLCEWKHFYRLLDDTALLHLFRVASSLDSMVVGESEVVTQVRRAWQRAQSAGATGRCLDAVLQKALAVSERVHAETAIGEPSISTPHAAVELARQVLGSLANRKALLLGAGRTSELAARELIKSGVGSVRIVNRTLQHGADLVSRLGGANHPAASLPFDERWREMLDADIILSSTSSQHTIFTRDEAAVLMQERRQRGRGQHPLVIIDIAMPRDIDAAVREVSGIYVYDLDDLESVADENAAAREAAAGEAQKILQAEAAGFRAKLTAERVLPTVVALRSRLDEICRQELESFRQESGPFSKDQDAMLHAVMSRMTQRIAGSLARELRELPEKVQQEQMAVALERLFHLPHAEQALAGTKTSARLTASGS